MLEMRIERTSFICPIGAKKCIIKRQEGFVVLKVVQRESLPIILSVDIYVTLDTLLPFYSYLCRVAAVGEKGVR